MTSEGSKEANEHHPMLLHVRWRQYLLDCFLLTIFFNVGCLDASRIRVDFFACSDVHLTQILHGSAGSFRTHTSLRHQRERLTMEAFFAQGSTSLPPLSMPPVVQTTTTSMTKSHETPSKDAVRRRRRQAAFSYETPSILALSCRRVAQEMVRLSKDTAEDASRDDSVELVVAFLRHCGYHPTSAAEHLSSYWHLRRHLFGSRAHLAMDQTGSGTLDAGDIALLSQGRLALIDQPDTDQKLLIDSGHAPSAAWERCQFYMLEVASCSAGLAGVGYVKIGNEPSSVLRLAESLPIDLEPMSPTTTNAVIDHHAYDHWQQAQVVVEQQRQLSVIEAQQRHRTSAAVAKRQQRRRERRHEERQLIQRYRHLSDTVVSLGAENRYLCYLLDLAKQLVQGRSNLATLAHQRPSLPPGQELPAPPAPVLGPSQVLLLNQLLSHQPTSGRPPAVPPAVAVTMLLQFLRQFMLQSAGPQPSESSESPSSEGEDSV